VTKPFDAELGVLCALWAELFERDVHWVENRFDVCPIRPIGVGVGFPQVLPMVLAWNHHVTRRFERVTRNGPRSSRSSLRHLRALR
jgi:hypothetical protein